MQLNDDAKADEDILFILLLQESEHKREDGSDMGSQEIVRWESVDHLQDMLPYLVRVLLLNELCFPVLKDTKKGWNGVF